MSAAARTVTELLRTWRQGDHAAADELMPLVYDELKRIANRLMRDERPGHTFRPTDLVSEAYLRLSAGAQPEWSDRVHFFAIAARSMRQILVDHARARLTAKRGDGERPVTFDDDLAAPDRPEVLVRLDAALDGLARQDERTARVMEPRRRARVHRVGERSRDRVVGAPRSTLAGRARRAPRAAGAVPAGRRTPGLGRDPDDALAARERE